MCGLLKGNFGEFRYNREYGFNEPSEWGRWAAWVLGEHGDLKCYISTSPPLPGTSYARDVHEGLDGTGMVPRDEDQIYLRDLEGSRVDQRVLFTRAICVVLLFVRTATEEIRRGDADVWM